MVAGNHSQITLEASYEATQRQEQQQTSSFRCFYCYVGGMKLELQHPLSPHFSYSHTQQFTLETKPSFHIQIVYHLSFSPFIKMEKHNLRQAGIGKKMKKPNKFTNAKKIGMENM